MSLGSRKGRPPAGQPGPSRPSCRPCGQRWTLPLQLATRQALNCGYGLFRKLRNGSVFQQAGSIATWIPLNTPCADEKRSSGGPCRDRRPGGPLPSEDQTVMSSPVWRTTSPELANRRTSPSSAQIATAVTGPDAELRGPQRGAAGLAPGQHAELSPHRVQLGGEPVDLPQHGLHGLPPGRGQLHLPGRGPALGRGHRADHRDALVEQGGGDPLMPGAPSRMAGTNPRRGGVQLAIARGRSIVGRPPNGAGSTTCPDTRPSPHAPSARRQHHKPTTRAPVRTPSSARLS